MTVQYLIDSENVGDFWIPLLELPGQDTELIVFYTRNSPHMSYDSLIRLKESDRTVTFIKCYEGTNALDFQLVSELGYRISKDEDGSFIIVTNDTGFDAAVKYWRRRKKSVKRITGKECRNLERRLREDLSIGSQQTRSANVSARVIADTERADEQDVHAETVPSEAAVDNDARPSRPNLRDAERAAQPDPDESFPPVDFDEMADADIDDNEDDADDYAYDPDHDEVDDAAYDSDEDDLQEDDAYDSEPDMNGDDDADLAAESQDVDADEEEEMSAAYDPDADETPAVEEADTDEDDAVTGKTAADETEKASENVTEDAVSDQEDFLRENGSEGESDQEDSEEAVTAEDLQDTPAQSAEKETTVYDEQNEVPSDTTADHVFSDEMTAEAVSDVTEPEEASAEDMSISEPEEEPAAETAHRSKSRRSRSRRSKSTARKQEQAAAAADSDESANAAEGAANAASADESGSRNTDTAKDDQEAAPADSSDALPEPGDEEIARIVACIGAENLAELHNQLATFYGEQGKDIYLSIKNNTRSLPVLKPDLKQKFAYYCEIIFYRSDYTGEYPSDISEYLLNVREKLNNLNSLRYALQKHYGKEKGRRFYFLLKPFAKTMYQM